MRHRVGAAALAVIGGLLVVVAVFTPSWWSGPIHIAGRVIHGKTVHISMLRATGCNSGGDGECMGLDVGAGFRVIGILTLLLAVATGLTSLLLALKSWNRSHTTSGFARLSLIGSAATVIGAAFFIAFVPERFEGIPAGFSPYLFFTGTAATALASVLALRRFAPARVTDEPVDVRELLSTDMLRPANLGPEPKMSRYGAVHEAPSFSAPAGPRFRPLYEVQAEQAAQQAALAAQQAALAAQQQQQGYDPNYGNYGNQAPGGYPPSSGAYPAANNGYPPASGAYPSATGAGGHVYPPMGAPPPSGSYPQANAPYPQTGAGGHVYPPMGAPPPSGSYPHANAPYAPGSGGYPQAGAFDAAAGGYSALSSAAQHAPVPAAQPAPAPFVPPSSNGAGEHGAPDESDDEDDHAIRQEAEMHVLSTGTLRALSRADSSIEPPEPELARPSRPSRPSGPSGMAAAAAVSEAPAAAPSRPSRPSHTPSPAKNATSSAMLFASDGFDDDDDYERAHSPDVVSTANLHAVTDHSKALPASDSSSWQVDPPAVAGAAPSGRAASEGDPGFDSPTTPSQMSMAAMLAQQASEAEAADADADAAIDSIGPSSNRQATEISEEMDEPVPESDDAAGAGPASVAHAQAAELGRDSRSDVNDSGVFLRKDPAAATSTRGPISRPPTATTSASLAALAALSKPALITMAPSAARKGGSKSAEIPAAAPVAAAGAVAAAPSAVLTTPPAGVSVAADPGASSPACPHCEAPMAWAEKHLRYYCGSCRMYF